MGKKPELLAPAGDFEKLKFALEYGADAVYAGLKSYSLRKRAKNFSDKEVKKAVEYTHERNKKIYIALNSYYTENDFDNLGDVLSFLEKIKVDALIVSDPGVINYIKDNKFKIPIHLSTQANTTNAEAARFWYKNGVERIILARELQLENIKEIVKKVPEMEFEAFIHGAMCVSYSGRCLMSSYLTGRDSNKGDCSHPCRWKYRLYYLEEQKRKNEFLPVYEHESGTYLFNSRDLNLSKKIPAMCDSNLSSLKIEGRIKSAYYVAVAVKVYRQIIDEYFKKGEKFKFKKKWTDELEKISHRDYTSSVIDDGFKPDDQIYANSSYLRTHKIIGYISETNEKGARIKLKNELRYGQQVDVIGPEAGFKQIVHDFYKKEDTGELVRTMKANHHDDIYMNFDKPVKDLYIIRAREN
ncbi:MAG: U32 family peptidase [Candidatus Muiribacteriota bacterium]